MTNVLAAAVGIAWTPAIQRGLIGLVFGSLALLGRDPSLSRVAPILLLYAMADGLVALGAAASAAYAGERWAEALAEAVAGIGGVLLLGAWPDAGASVLVGCVVLWATLTAVGVVVANPARERRFAEAAIVMMRFCVIAIAAGRSGRFGVALWGGASALGFAGIFVKRLDPLENRRADLNR